MMLTSVPAVLKPDQFLGNPFENGFTPWDCAELYPDFDPKPAGSSSGSDGPSEHKPAGSDSGSGPVVDDRKKRRMISNRESARRSRMRKQKHLENLRNKAARLKVENRELTNRLRHVLYSCHVVKSENQRLLSERTLLRQRLNRVQDIMMLRQLQQLTSAWPCINTNNINDHCAPNNDLIMMPTSMPTMSNEQIPIPQPSLIAS